MFDDKIMDMKFRDVLDTYGAIFNYDCGFCYGIAEYDTLDELFQEYDIEHDYPEAFVVENLVSNEIFDAYEDEVLNYDKLERIMSNLGITKKREMR